jgi:hypothetical protein
MFFVLIQVLMTNYTCDNGTIDPELVLEAGFGCVDGGKGL